MIKLKKIGTFYHLYRADELLGKFTLDEILEIAVNGAQSYLEPRGVEDE